VRRGLTALIDNEPDLMLCAEAATQRPGLESIVSCNPDLVITGLFFGEADGLSPAKEIRSLHGGKYVSPKIGFESPPLIVAWQAMGKFPMPSTGHPPAKNQGAAPMCNTTAPRTFYENRERSLKSWTRSDSWD